MLIWNELLRLSGAVVLKEPKFFYVLQCMFMKFACERNGNVSDITISYEEPYVQFGDLARTTDKINQISECYKKLLNFVKENEKLVNEIESESHYNLIVIDDLMRDIVTVLKNNNVPPIKK